MTRPVGLREIMLMMIRLKIRTALIGKLFDQNLNPLYDVDWQKATTRTAYSQNHNVTFTGGSDNLTYGLFLNYADDEGIIFNSYQKRYNARLTIDHQVKPWLKVGATINYNSSEQRTAMMVRVVIISRVC
jgi:hypothetical protein